MARIHLIVPYFGEFLNYFQLFLNSLRCNPLVKIHLFTDIDIRNYEIPNNLRVVHFTLSEFRQRMSKFLLKHFNEKVEENEIVSFYRKLCDYKVTYPLFFEDEMTEIPASDFIGYGDLDVIYGNLEKFLDLEADAIGVHHGHFTAYRNLPVYKFLFLQIPNYVSRCKDSNAQFIDELDFHNLLTSLISSRGGKICWLKKSLCDIIPACHYYLFPNFDFTRYKRNFRSNTNIEKNIHYLEYTKGCITAHYDDKTTEEVSYLHLQKHEMKLEVDITSTMYFINETSFLEEAPRVKEVIPRHVFLTWKSKDFPPLMKASVEALKSQNPKFKFSFFDNDDCERFLSEHYPKEVLLAFRRLIPGAYKADLWRLCVLYKYGGIYLDIKFQCINGFQLSSLLDREYFATDGTFLENGIAYDSVYNAIIVCKKKSEYLLRGIVNIVRNVQEGFYGNSPYIITGPHLMGKCHHFAKLEKHYPIKFVLTDTADYVEMNGKGILKGYSGYRQEIPPQNKSYYRHAWDLRKVFDESISYQLDLSLYSERIQKYWFQMNGKVNLHVPCHPEAKEKTRLFLEAMMGQKKYNVYYYGSEDFPCSIRIQTSNFYESFLQMAYHPRMDVICLAFSHRELPTIPDVHRYSVFEFSVDYNDSHAPYKAYPSRVAADKNNGRHYHFFVPPYLQAEKYSLRKDDEEVTIGFIGKNPPSDIFLEVSKQFPTVTFIVSCSTKFAVNPNIKYYSGFDFLQKCSALLLPYSDSLLSCQEALEAQACGIPVIAPDWGVFPEIIKQKETGLLCHTIADYCYGVDLVLRRRFNSEYIRNRILKRHSLSTYQEKISVAIETFLDLWRAEKRGWFSPDSHLRQENQEDKIFTDIYTKNLWQCGSGTGSKVSATEIYREFLQKYMKEHNIKSVVDYGCGDWQFSCLIDWTGIDYTGYDIVEHLVKINQRKYGTENIKFEHFTGQEIKDVDLIICKDVLQHCEQPIVARTLAMFQRHAKRILVTNDYGQQCNREIKNGQWTELDIRKYPFCIDSRILLEYTVPCIPGLPDSHKAVFELL